MGQHPLQTRYDRAHALLRQSSSVLQRLSQTSLTHVLHPFRCKQTDPFSVVAFIHAFGCDGPKEHDWHALFAAAGALRPVDLAVLVAYVACPDKVEDILFGSPGILDHVCRLWDEWLVTEAVRIMGDTVEAEAGKWRVVKSTKGLVWESDATEDGVTSHFPLGQSVDVVGMRIVKDVMRRIVEQILDRVSLGGEKRFMEMFAERGTAVVDMARARAKTVLVEKVFQVAAERNSYTA